jgi:glycosyltransferase involved in cell wall biosynthesis
MTMIAAEHDEATLCPGVNYYGPFGIVGGLGSAARGNLAAMRAAGINVATIPVNEMFVHHANVVAALRTQAPRHAISIVHANADSVRRFVHFRGKSFSRARYKIGVWVWELPALRDQWWSEIRRFDEIWTPSRFCQRAVQALTDKPVIFIPSVVTPVENPAPGFREVLGIDNSKFLFLYMFDAASFVARKNPFCLVDAFQSAFPDDDGVRLVLKAGNVRPNSSFALYLDALELKDKRCIVIRQTMSAGEVAALTSACDCYVSPHRSEGFGFTVAEAMAYGAPVIATDYSATADFLDDEVGFPLPYRLVEIEEGDSPYPQGAIWADPSREDLRDLLRFVVAHPQAARAKAERGRARIRDHYSAAAIGRLIEKRLQTIAKQ